MEIKILITGGSGFIGTNLLQYYLDKNIDVLNIDIVKPRNIKHINYYENIDICDKNALVDCVSEFKPSHIVHLAARTDLDGNSLDEYKTNTVGVSNLVDAINNSCSVVKVIFASSMLVCEVGYQPNDYDDYKTSTFYGESKALSERFIKSKASISSDWNIIRPTSIWGPWFAVPYRNFFDMILQGRYVNIKGVTATKTFGFVGNAIYQIDALLFSQKNSISRKTYYIGDNPPTNISEWANEILKSLGKRHAVELPLFFFKILAYLGDMLGAFGISFPMSSFRLRNMTTNNIQNLEDLYNDIGSPPFSRLEGIDLTLEWLKVNEK